MWLSLAFLSATLLGVYDVFKKVSLNKNAVIPVLFLNTVFCSLIFLPLIIASYSAPEMMQKTIFFVPKADFHTHLYIVAKSAIVLTSWLCAYFALKHLPITIASPIKASQPILTLVGAFCIFSERLNMWQWGGVLVSLLAFYLLSVSGKNEGIKFSHIVWIWCIVGATITCAIRGLYVIYLMLRMMFVRMIFKSLFNFSQAVMFGLMFLCISNGL